MGLQGLGEGRGGWRGGRAGALLPVQGLAGHGTNFRFYSKCNGNPLKGLEQRSVHILRKHFDCG